MVVEDRKQNDWDAFMHHLITGGIAGGVSRTSTAPLDRIKIFFQVSRSSPKFSTTLRKLVQEGGWTGLWRGNFLNVVKSTPKSAVKFACYDGIKRVMRGNESRPMAFWERLFAGSIAGFVSQSMFYPLDMLKVRMALRKTGQYSGLWDAIVKIYRREGMRAFGRGFLANAAGILPNSGIELALYETSRDILEEERGLPTLTGMELLLIGSAAGLISQTATYPMAMVCTVMQAKDCDSSTKRKGYSQVIQEIYQRGGLAAFYRGMAPNLLKFVPLTGISYFTYEYCNTFFGISMT